MAIELLSETPIFHGMALDVVAEDNVALPDLTPQFVAYLNGTMHEMWMGDPHAKPELLAIEPGPGPITQSLSAVQVMDSTRVIGVGEGDLPTQTIKTVVLNLEARRG